MKRLLTTLLIFTLGFISALIALSLISGPSTMTFVDTYHSALDEAKKTSVTGLNADRWKEAIADLASPELGAKVLDTYAKDIYFNDTLKTIHTAEELSKHFDATAALLHSGSVKYLSEFEDENGDYYVRWEMTYSGKKLNGGKPIVTIGMSQLRFNEAGEVIFHQDFWDSTSGVFEHIPVIGGLIRYLRSRM